MESFYIPIPRNYFKLYDCKTTSQIIKDIKDREGITEYKWFCDQRFSASDLIEILNAMPKLEIFFIHIDEPCESTWRDYYSRSDSDNSDDPECSFAMHSKRLKLINYELNLPHLKSLHITTDFPGSIYKFFARYLPKDQLNELTIEKIYQDTYRNEIKLSEIVEILKSQKKLEKLTLDICVNVSDIFECLPNVKNFKLQTTQKLNVIAKKLPQLEKLEVQIDNGEFCEFDTEIKNENLKSLILDVYDILDEFWTILETYPNLEHLKVHCFAKVDVNFFKKLNKEVNNLKSFTLSEILIWHIENLEELSKELKILQSTVGSVEIYVCGYPQGKNISYLELIEKIKDEFDVKHSEIGDDSFQLVLKSPKIGN